MKSGTSSLFSYLAQHPQLSPSITKEIHFFDGGIPPDVDNFSKGQSWYRTHFPLTQQLGSDSRTFEASPLYIFSPLAPKRIFDLVPNVKIVAILRNPTERAISHYFHERRKDHEILPIYEALQKEEERLTPIIAEEDYRCESFIHHSYKSRGHYRIQMERYLKYFPWQQTLILSSDELFSDPDKTLRKVFDFVGVDTKFKIGNLKAVNVASNRNEVNPEVYDYLDRYFLPHNRALYELIGRNFGW